MACGESTLLAGWLAAQEPGFATIVPRQPSAGQQQQAASSSSSIAARPCVHGVLHRVTRREWAHIKATEGVGSQHAGYQARGSAAGAAARLLLRAAQAHACC